MEVITVDSNRTLDVGSLLDSVAQTLTQNQSGLNSTDVGQGGGTHGDRIAQAFGVAAQAARQTAGQSNDAGAQFAAAAQAMRQAGQGKATQYYANGLEEAAQQFRGQQGVSAADLGPLLQSFVGGAQRNNPAQPGQGSMLDALLPALQGFTGAKNQGLDESQAALHALSGAVTGAQGTAQLSRGGYGPNIGGGRAPSGNIDPGAASATSIISGIIGALLPGVLGSLMSGGLGGLGGGRQSPMQPGGSYPPMAGSDPLGGLGGLLGGLGGLLGGGGSLGQTQGGGLFGGGQSPLGGLGGLGGLLGGNEPNKDKPDNTRYV